MSLNLLSSAPFPVLAAWSAQILILVAIAAIAVLALRHPKARLLFWQGVLLLALLLPAVEPWKPAPVEAITASASVIVRVAPIAGPPAPWYSRIHWRPEYLLALLTGGASLRLLWMAVGLLRLRRYRSQAEVLADPPLGFVGKSVRWYMSDAIPGPVTYGWLRPSILLPGCVQSLAAPLREAIACHELVHVRRGDWLFVLAEEIVRSLFWFHPAVWYVISQIQLGREQVVDREAVGLTENRDCYLDALIAVAGHRLPPDLAPATLFLKKRHLAVRVAEMMKEVSMSRSRIFASLSGVFSAALLAARLAVWFFPMTSPAQTVVDDPGITVDAGGTLFHRSAIHYPPGPRIAGAVSIEATLNSKGEVSDARVISGPDELRKAALASVLDWHYSTSAGVPPHVQISIRFDPPASPAPPAAAPVRAEILPAAPDSATQIKSMVFSGISPEAEQELRNRLQIHEGDTVTTADMLRVSQAVQEYDSHLRASFTMRAAANEHETVLRIAVLPQANGSGPLPAPGGRGGAALLATKDGQAAVAGLEKQLSPRKAALQKEQADIQEMQDKLQKGANTLSQTAKDEQSRAIDAAIKKFNRDAEDYNAEAENAQRKALDGLAAVPAPAPNGQTIPSQGPEISAAGAIRVGGYVQSMKLVKQPVPAYPQAAKDARIQGVVKLTARIAADGAVQDVQVVSGHPLLVPAAVDAVKQWVYQPTLLNGNPVAVITEVDVNFTLAQ